MRSSAFALALCAALAVLPSPALSQMDSDFSTGGAVKIGTSTTTCNAAIEGAIRYDSAGKCMEFCSGNAWTPLNACSCIDGLVGHWKFDDGSGSSATDSSGNSNTGTLSGPTWTTGKIGGALDFDGSNDKVTVPHAASLNPSTTGDMTIAAWVYNHDGGGEWRAVVAKNREGGANASSVYGIWRDSGTPGQWYLRAGDSDANNNITRPSTINTWTHLAYTFTVGGTMEAFVNGASVGTDTKDAGQPTDATNELNIGFADFSGSTEYFDGLIDDLRVYSTILSDTEISAIYNGGAGCL